MEYYVLYDYLEYCRTQKRLSEHSLRAYEGDLKQYYGVKIFDVKDYIIFLSNNIKKTSTLKRKIASLKSFYYYLEENNIIKENPFYKLHFRFSTEKILPKTISHEELKKIYKYFYDAYKTKTESLKKEKTVRNLLIIELLISTGLRVSELCNIKVEDIDICNRNILVFGKGKKERIIYIGNIHTYSLLLEYIDTYRKNNPIFLFAGQNEDSNLNEQSVRLMLKGISKKLSLNRPVTPHMFRHTFATMLLENNVDIRYIQHILGHSSIAVTQIYTHVSQNKQQEILTINNPLNCIFE